MDLTRRTAGIRTAAHTQIRTHHLAGADVLSGSDADWNCGHAHMSANVARAATATDVSTGSKSSRNRAQLPLVHRPSGQYDHDDRHEQPRVGEDVTLVPGVADEPMGQHNCPDGRPDVQRHGDTHKPGLGAHALDPARCRPGRDEVTDRRSRGIQARHCRAATGRLTSICSR